MKSSECSTKKLPGLEMAIDITFALTTRVIKKKVIHIINNSLSCTGRKGINNLSAAINDLSATVDV